MKLSHNHPLVLPLVLLLLWSTPMQAATLDEFVGNWQGGLSLVSEDESGVFDFKVSINNSDGTAVGTVSDEFTSTPRSFQGAVVNGNLVFPFPNMDPGNPDCANWDFPAVASFNDDGTTMHLTASGTVCGRGGGKEGTLEGDLTRQEVNLQPILFLLTGGSGLAAGDWFFSGSDIGGNHTWWGPLSLNNGGALESGTVNSSVGSVYSLVNGQFDADGSGVVTGHFKDSDSTTTEFSMQVDQKQEFMAGPGKALGESENGLYLFVRKSTGATGEDLQGTWYLSWTDLVAGRSCAGVITFDGVTGQESLRSATGDMECTDDTTRTYKGGALGSLVVNDPSSTAVGNVTGSLLDNSDRSTNLVLQLGAGANLMAGLGKGVTDDETGLYIFVKQSSNNAATADLQGEWFVTGSDLKGNRTWKGIFTFDSAGKLTGSGTLTGTDGATWNFTSGSMEVDPATGQVVGKLTDDVSSVTDFYMQINEEKTAIAGAAGAGSDSDNGLFIFIRR